MKSVLAKKAINKTYPQGMRILLSNYGRNNMQFNQFKCSNYKNK